LTFHADASEKSNRITCDEQETVEGLTIDRRAVDVRLHLHFMLTGACFIKDGKTYRLTHGIQMQQARKADIDC